MTGPLEGIRIISMAEQYPGPYCTLLLADMGADVILVERPQGGDPARGPAGISDFFAALARNKRSVTVDLKKEAGREVVRRLAADADAFVEGFRPGVARRLGVGYEDLRRVNPRLVYASISGFGQTGPYRDRPAHDLSYQAMAGLLYNLIPGGNFEGRPAVAIGDLSSGMFSALAIVAALTARQRTGQGQYIDVSMTDGLLSWMTTALASQLNRGGWGDPIGGEPAYGVFRCADGRFLTLSIAFEDHFWRNLCGALGRPDLAGLGGLERRRRRQELAGIIQDIIATRPRDEWVDLLVRADVACGPVSTLEEVAADPHFRERGMFLEWEGPGEHRWLVNHPLKFSETPASVRRPAPRLGEHTEEVLTEIGYSRQEVARLREEGAV